MLVRLQKYLADAGIASRRKAEELIKSGNIQVNGNTVTQLGTKINTLSDVVYYNGQLVKIENNKVYILLHKPEGYITTTKDQFNRATVLDIIKDIDVRLYPVGRLDYDTSGALILTNDGELAHKLTHPKYNIDKTYLVRMMGEPNSMEMSQIKKGVIIDGIKTAPAKIKIVRTDGKICTVTITIHEGKNHQIKKMCKAINHPVASLKRLTIGEISLGDLPKGKYRTLTKKELLYLKNL